ncbi:carbon-nitrogen hydrolase family protein [Phycisphaera mikurensis]|uniref:Putative hydrolase n=1 Tax=Phycisphaera mikurensis (strain NBRC 102666 / KCTC 22515 / FYK2301M01) TaxID=1142394 RepID=I0IBM4_PHYMF|nr:carbon-nitrogen hydrolase family protein [Phycisphaera mikurensis]MBB6442809.1 putative amidohydrolase [Phycisphaera mikurensis]BAM02662.1 putative hydrolase [Phycisphaera mikurensis NBRC 102666]
MNPQRIRVASCQYFIRPVERFEQFEAQVEGLVDTAADYGVKLLVFPEYFTCQLLTTLGTRDKPIDRQVRHLAELEGRIVEMFQRLAKKSGMYIVGGTLPAVDPPDLETLYNECYLYAPSGEWEVQGKIHMTRFEKEEWRVSPHTTYRVFDTELGRIAINICYDVEFPELARAAALRGANILVVPSCTDERQGFLRVRYCAAARAIENQMYVVHSGTVGSLPNIPAVSLNYGQASILSPSDFGFGRDGVIAEGVPNQESLIIGEVDLALLQERRDSGTVLPLEDARSAKSYRDATEVVSL